MLFKRNRILDWMEFYCEVPIMVVYLHSRSCMNIIKNYSVLICSNFHIYKCLFCLLCKYNTCIFDTIFVLIESRDGGVGIEIGYGLDDPDGVRVRVLAGARIFSSPRRPDRFWGPPILLFNGRPGLKWPVREADHSPPTSAEVK
jgi:hypothetical protein